MSEITPPTPDRDPFIYPVAEEFIAFGAAIFVTQTTARNCPPEEANAEAAEPSWRGERTGYAAGRNIKAKPYKRDDFQ